MGGGLERRCLRREDVLMDLFDGKIKRYDGWFIHMIICEKLRYEGRI